MVLSCRFADGVNVEVTPEKVSAPAIAAPLGGDRVKVAVLIVEAFIVSLKVAVTTCVTGTPVARFAGMVETTNGATNPDCSRPQPAAKTLSAITNNQILPPFVCMRLSCVFRADAFPGPAARG